MATRMLNKNLTPNLVALLLIIVSFSLPEPWKGIVLTTGLFALSGALTNWLAVHMLFERVPGLYGSGVITLHFEDFKAGILRMVHEELFNKDSVERLLRSSKTAGSDTAGTGDASTTDTKQSSTLNTKQSSTLNTEQTSTLDSKQTSTLVDAVDIESLLNAIDLDAAYDQLVATVVDSSFGSMLAMVGGEEALQPLRDPFKIRMQTFLSNTAKSPRIQAAISEQLSKAASSDQFVGKLEQLLRARLDEMTPEMIKEIMQRMIREHLGWLVVWGGVFGGIIGLIASLFTL